MRAARGGAITLAFALDLALGEPPERWHPVCWMGRAVGAAERLFVGADRPSRVKRGAGTAVAVVLPLATYMAARGLVRSLPRPAAFAAEVLGMWTAFAARSLYDRALAVERGLSRSLTDGRDQVAHMVGRDTGELDAAGVARAAVESVAENANDGVVAPLLYASAGGAPLALAYKMVNTLDSMVGYRDVRYREFGWASARLDDVAGYVPARMTAGAVIAAAAGVGADPLGAARLWRRDARRQESPNAGVCEAAFAGALGVRLGGGDTIGGVHRQRALIGAELEPPCPDDIIRAARLMLAVSATVLAALLAVRAVTGRGRGFSWAGGDE